MANGLSDYDKYKHNVLKFNCPEVGEGLDEKCPGCKISKNYKQWRCVFWT